MRILPVQEGMARDGHATNPTIGDRRLEFLHFQFSTTPAPWSF
jgi:hypothetical protein